MRSFTLVSLLALLVSASAGRLVDPLDTLSGVLQGVSLELNNSSATESSGPEVPQRGRLKVAGEYYMAMGQHYRADYRGRYSQYVAGITYKGSGMKIGFQQRSSGRYLLQVQYNPLSPRPLRWYLGAHRSYAADSFADKMHSLRLITHSAPEKAGLWKFIQNPSDPDTMLMVLQTNLGRSALDVSGWYLALSDSPAAERDCISTYLTVTDDHAKATTVEFVD